MKEVTMYKAFDGTMFDNVMNCMEYEKLTKERVVEDFRSLIVRENEGLQITKEGSAFPLAEIAECWWYAVIVMKDEEDYQKVVRYANSRFDGFNRGIPKIFNKEIIVTTGEGNKERSYYNDFYFDGTVEDAIANYTMALLTFNVEKGD